MSRILESKGGFYKHFFLGLFFALGCHLAVLADPIFTPTAFISMAVSLAFTAATATLTYVLTPKPKPVDKNKLQGEIQISSVGEDIFINEIYGARGSDGKGGIKTGVNFFYVSDIRGVVETKSSSSGGGKGGKRADVKEHHYYVDLACLVGQGRTRILEIRAGTKVLYRNYPKPTQAQGTHYQLETATLTGGAAIENNALFASGQAVKAPSSSTITKTVIGDGSNQAFYLQYLTATDKTINVTINGEARQIALPKTFGRVESVMVNASTNNGNTTVFIQVPANDDNNLWLDEIIVAESFADNLQISRFVGISGLKNHNYENPYPTYDYNFLRDPLADDYRAADEYNYQANYDNQGSTDVSLPAGCSLRIYEGTADQLPDPMLQAWHEPLFGAGSTPAFRHRCYFVLDNFEITEYGNVPNITVVSESVDCQTLGAMYAKRAKEAGLEESEFDFSAFDNIPIRGYAITQRQAPRAEIEVLNRIFDIDVLEDNDGKIKAIVPTDDIIVQIPASDLDVFEGTNEGDKKPIGLKSLIRNEYETPKRFDLSYFDPLKDFEIGNAGASREVTVSEKRDNIETSLVLTQEEAQKIVDRLHQQAWAEKDGEEFSTFYKYGWLKPTDLVEVVSVEGEVNRVRLKQRNGNAPGKLNFVGVSRNIAFPSPRIFLEPTNQALNYPWINVPPHVIGTIIDMAMLRTTETVAGFYAACVMTDQAYQFKGASLVWEREAGYERLQVFNSQATMGRTVLGSGGILADVPNGWTLGAWDTSSTLTFDLFFGEVETRTDAEVLDKYNGLIVGNEIISFQTAVRVNGYPNRWTVSRLKRRLKGTFSNGHANSERVVLLNDAVKFIPLDLSEFGKTRNYKFVSSGQEIDAASGFSFTWDGNTNPQELVRDKGRDSGQIPISAIGAKIESATVNGDNADVLLAISLNNLFDTNNNIIHNNSDSANAIQVEVFNQFGESIKLFEPAAANNLGGQFVCKFSRKYADAFSGQGYFKIMVTNYFGFSSPVYLQGNNLTTSPPTVKLRANCPLDAYGVPFSSSAIRCFYQFSGNVNLLRRKVGDSVFETHASGVSSSPYLAQGLAEYSDYELQFVSAADANNKSNIFAASTKQQGEAVPSRPVPTGATGSVNTANPQTQLDFSCISSANVETEVWVNGGLATTLSAVSVGQTINYSISGLSASTSRAVKFRHKWGMNDYSDSFTEEITRTTNALAPTEETPIIDSGYYDDNSNESAIYFTPKLGTGNFILERKINAGSWIVVNSDLENFSPCFDTISQGSIMKTAYYRMKRINSALPNPYSNEYAIQIPPFDRYRDPLLE